MTRQKANTLANVPVWRTQLRAILERSRQQFRDGEWVSEEDFWSEFEPKEPPKKPAKPRRKKA